MPDEFHYAVFLSPSAKDTVVVRPLAEQLHQGRQKVSQPSTLNHQPLGGSEWARLEAGMGERGNLPFRDPLNQERRSGDSEFALPIWNLKSRDP